MAAVISIDPKRLYTKAEYARAYNINRVKLDALIKAKAIKTLPVNGGVLVVAERG